MDTWKKYYRGLYAFINRNCARLIVTKLILRITLPVFPMNDSGPWWPPTSAPLFSELIQKLGSRNIDLYVYPYLMDAYNQDQWAAFSPDETNSVQGVFEFVKEWNIFLDGMGIVQRFKGVVFDYEEFWGSRNPTILAQVKNLAPLKAAYGDLKTGIALGYQPFTQMTNFDSVMDEFYLEFYDYYYVPYVAQTSQSPFILYRNDPAELVPFTLTTVLEGFSEMSSKYGPKVNVMWSVQEIRGTCPYPLTDGTCGINYEFGSWSASGFNKYLELFRAQSPNLGSKPNGIFQYNFIPTSWHMSPP
jgi:hypothetical protein